MEWCPGWLGCHADLDHTNEELRLSIIDWMSWLKTEIGYHGWRFDFTKVFPALQRGGRAAYRLAPGAVAAIAWALHHWLKSQERGPQHVAGECVAESSSTLAWVAQGFGGEYVAEYIKATGMDGEFNVGRC